MVQLDGMQLSVDELSNKAKIALRDSAGNILAIVVRNADGAFGRHVLHDAGIHIGESNVRTQMAMAGPNRTSSLTSGSTTSNDNADPVPHCPACRFDSAEKLESTLARLRESGAQSTLVVGGNDMFLKDVNIVSTCAA